MDRCSKHGRVLSARKVDVSDMLANIEHFPLLPEPYQSGNPYPNAVAMDEFIWKKKEKRAIRIGDRDKDKVTVDKGG